MNMPSRPDAREAQAVTEATLALAGHELHPYTRELTTKMGRGELTGDQAVDAIITRFVAPTPRG